ncbi:hypothetical protein [Pseudofrankia asymbiotica]|uniref:Uncharacterized protein n=1 Tax=Pseudofrankia asymbiotica TaxID=1834516 RepID=A0A1V2I2D8_9ACTN|nr:hypothetical protein [Pseudofrankia asymbiotica]ONH24172.1 hypothetical protein BL253_30915 [Pseudofrankia asymbiotica]
MLYRRDRYYHRPLFWWMLVRWFLIIALLYLVLFAFSYVVQHVLPVIGPILIVGGLVYGGIALVQRGRSR